MSPCGQPHLWAVPCRGDSAGSRDTQYGTSIFPLELGQSSPLSPSCSVVWRVLTQLLESGETWMQGGCHCRCYWGQITRRISEATWHCTWKTLEFSQFYFVTMVSGQTLCVSFMLVLTVLLLWTSSFRCAQTSSVLSEDRTWLVCCRPAVYSASLHNLQGW